MASELRAVVLPLYRNILRLHREKLPPVMREIGDKYVKTEFKARQYFLKINLDFSVLTWLPKQAHNNVKTTENQWREFVSQWRLYVSTLDGSVSYI